MAWAVTIHKSQGLTFDRLIIDAGKSFASGQVYVALSRCRTLEGIVLKSKITPEIIFNDHRVSGFQDATNANDKIDQILGAEKYDYSIGKVIRRLDLGGIKTELEAWNRASIESKKLDHKKSKSLYTAFKKETENLQGIFEKFEKIIISKTKKFIAGNEEWSEIEAKSKGAVLFFFNNINDKIFEPFKEFYAETKGVAGLKAYNEAARVFLDDLEDYLKNLQELKLLETPLYEQAEKKPISAKVAKVPTHIITWQLFEEGKSISEIAKERGVLNTTIIGHFSKFAETGVLTKDELKRILPMEKISEFEKQYKEEKFDTLNDWKKNLPDDFDYGEIRLLWTFYDNKK